MVRYKDWSEMREKAANKSNTFLKDLQKARRTISQDHFKRIKSLAPWKQNIMKWGVTQDL